jgi:hypothetical protein
LSLATSNIEFVEITEEINQLAEEYINEKVVGETSIDDCRHIACATINIPEEDLANDQVIIKDYSENEGMLGTLICSKIITVPWRRTTGGNHPVCKLLLPIPK